MVRIAHIVLFVIASRDEPGLRASVTGLAVSTAVAVGILVAASFTDGALQGGLWLLALALDMGGPAFFGVEGWKLEPEHFAERHGLIIIIALGESIVAIGVGAEEGLTTGSVVAAVVAVFISAALWWLYFDIVALVAARRLEHAAPGRERNAIARDSFSFLHLPMIAGIVLLALGFKKTLEHVDDALKIQIAVAMLGGLVAYLLAHVAFRWRTVHRFSSQRVVAAVVLAALTPVAIEVPALVTLALVLLVLVVLIVYENRHFAELRERLRHQVEPPSSAHHVPRRAAGAEHRQAVGIALDRDVQQRRDRPRRGSRAAPRRGRRRRRRCSPRRRSRVRRAASPARRQARSPSGARPRTCPAAGAPCPAPRCRAGGPSPAAAPRPRWRARRCS